jgi:hypothetical protein
MISTKQLVGAWRKARKRGDWRKADAYWHDAFARVHGGRITIGRDGWSVMCVDPRLLVVPR